MADPSCHPQMCEDPEEKVLDWSTSEMTVSKTCHPQKITVSTTCHPKTHQSSGLFHAAEREVRKLGAALSRHTGQEESEAQRHLWGRLGILLQRGNAAILGNRVPMYPDARIDGRL